MKIDKLNIDYYFLSPIKSALRTSSGMTVKNSRSGNSMNRG